MAAWREMSEVRSPRPKGVRRTAARRAPHTLGEAEAVREERRLEADRRHELLDDDRHDYTEAWIYGTERDDYGFDWYTNG